MRDLPMLMLAGIWGALLGTFFFVGLWWTVTRGMSAQRPALLFLGSLIVRTAVVLGAIYAVSGDSAARILACIAGFVIARVVVKRWVGAPAGGPPAPGIHHGP